MRASTPVFVKTACLLVAAALAAPSMAAIPPVSLKTIATGTSLPVGLIQTPDPDDTRIFILQQGGLIRILDGGTILSTAFLNISSLISTSPGNERGLLGLAFHPEFGAGTGKDVFYINYTNTSGNTIIARYGISAGNANLADTGSVVLLQPTGGTSFVAQPFSNHNGGNLLFGPDDYLYIGLGDGGSSNDPNCNAQNINTRLGKMLRIDVNSNFTTAPYFGIPSTNPYVGVAGLDEIWAIGLRNPWRYSFDKQTGDLWIADVGQDAREEIDMQPASSTGGENYGWKAMEGFGCTGLSAGCSAAGVTLAACNSPSYKLPVIDFIQTTANGICAIIGGYVYRGSAIPSLQGKYVYGDYCSGDVWAYDPVSKTTDQMLNAIGPIYTFGEMRDGELLIGVGSTVYQLVPNRNNFDQWRLR